MLTYTLVRPSFALFKLASIFGAIPFQVQVSTGKMEAKATASSQLALRIHRLLALFKILQLLSSIFHLSKSLAHSPRSVGNAVVVIIALSAVVVGLVWNLELEKHLNELIILLSSLRKTGESYDVPCLKTSAELDNKKGKFFKRKLAQIARAFGFVRVHGKEFYDDLVQFVPTFSYHDTLTIFLSLADPLSLCAIHLRIIIGDTKDAFFLANLLGAERERIVALRTGTALLDLIVITLTFIALSFHLTFFTICAVLAMNTPELKKLERFVEEKGIKSPRRMRYVWEEIRRLVMTFHLLNHLASNCFYMGKVLAFTWSVFGTFYVLRFGITDMVSGAMAFFAFEAITFYVQCLGSAYVITETMDSILGKMKSSSEFSLPITRRELKQRIKSIRPVALAESGFREISRETTPEFVDFYFNQVIALVLTF